jgi:hypothetical protein
MRRTVLAVALSLSACTGSMNYSPDKFTDNDKAIMEKSFRQNLADPSSVQVQGVTVFQSPNGNRMICGSFNAKNAFGGYIGYQQFLVTTAGSVDYTKAYARPIFGTAMVASIDCRGAGYVPVL